MILFTFVTIAILITGLLSIGCIAAFGSVGLVLFGDLIVFVILMKTVIKHFIRNHRRKK